MPDRFQSLHQAMQRHVDAELLPGLSAAVMVGREVVDEHVCGWADRENRVPLGRDHIFRMFSSTKLITSCAALLLWEQGHFELDDAIEPYLPALARRQVLRPGASRIDDTEPARSSITVRQLLSHSAGLSYGLLDPGSLMFQAYTEHRVLDPTRTLAEMVEALGTLPLSYHPGTGWEYSVATDVVSRLVEVISGQRFGDFIHQHILQPLGMVDTAFVPPLAQQHRLTAIYAGADPMNPLKPGLTRSDDFPYPGAYRTVMPKQSGGGGLASTLPDTIALLRSLLPGGDTLLKPETLKLLFTNQIADGVHIRFAGTGPIVGRGHSLAGALSLSPWRADPADAAGDLQWGGIAGTHWWISPRDNMAGIVLTQRQMAFWNPFWFELKALMRRAVSGG